MKRFNGYDEAKKNAQYKGAPKLPAGAYVLKILNVRYEEGKDGNSDTIAVQLDVAEGEYKDFYKKDFESNTSEDKKWRGRKVIYVPKEDGSERDGWTMNAFAKWTNALEDSNPGYSWDWDENKWKGLEIGAVYRNSHKMIEGKPVSFTEIGYVTSAKDVREGNTAPAKEYFSKDWNAGANSNTTKDSFVNVPEGVDEEIPF